MSVLIRIAVLGLALALTTACTGEKIRIDPVPNPAEVDRTRGRKISATVKGFQFFLVLPLNINTRHEKAYRELVRQAGDDVIAEVTIKESWAYGVIGTAYTTTIEAMAYPRKQRAQLRMETTE